MYEGPDGELIEESKSARTLEQEELHDERIRGAIESREQDDRSAVQEDRLCEILNSLEGKTVCGTLDFLGKVNSALLSRDPILNQFTWIIFIVVSPGAGEIRR